jgi:hypothetical protein
MTDCNTHGITVSTYPLRAIYGTLSSSLAHNAQHTARYHHLPFIHSKETP